MSNLYKNLLDGYKQFLYSVQMLHGRAVDMLCTFGLKLTQSKKRNNFCSFFAGEKKPPLLDKKEAREESDANFN